MTTSATQPAPPPAPLPASWLRATLTAAGIYNLLWGALVVLFPAAIYRLVGMEPPEALWLWQCIGMIVGVYGIGYLIAARDPRRHWPIVLVGLLGKVFGPIGFGFTLLKGEVPAAFGLVLVTNDFIWWVPFAMLLWDAARTNSAPTRSADQSPSPEQALAETRITAGPGAGETLIAYSRRQPLLVVFLRHAGCTFCREALSDLAAQQRTLENAGVRNVLVHMGDDAELLAAAANRGITNADAISDPDQRLYSALNLRRGGFAQLFGPRIWLRGAAAVFRGHGLGSLAGDGFQLGGVFLVRDGRIAAARPLRDAADRPDYAAVACPVSA